MQTKVYCRTVAKGRQAFYVNANGKEYFLFEQDFRASNKEFFKKGYYLTDKVDYSKVRSTAVRMTLEKLPSYIRYIESEYGVSIYEKTKKKLETKHRNPYKRATFRWQDYAWEVA